MISIAERMNNHSIWKELVLREDLSITNAIQYAKKYFCMDQIPIRPDFTDLPFDEILNIMKNIYFTKPWVELVKKETLTLEEAFTLAKHIDDLNVWESFVSRSDFKALPTSLLMEYLHLIDSSVVWHELYKSKDFKQMDIQTLLDYAFEVNNDSLWRVLFSREDFKLLPLDEQFKQYSYCSNIEILKEIILK